MDPATMAMLMQMGNSMKGGAGQLLSGLFGNSGAPYEDYGKEYEKYANRGKEYQNPFWEAGKKGIGDYAEWGDKMKDPSGFVNNLMGGYQESPWARFQKQQGERAGQNAASAGGLMGSTPMMQASQDYAGNISSQDQQNWLKNVLGVNTEYGQSKNNLMNTGQNAANSLQQLQQLLAQNMGEAEYGERAGRNQDTGNMISGGLKFLFG